MDPLSPKQRAFVREYLVDQNGKQAAIRAGYSKKTAEAQASRLLRNVKVRAEVEKKTAKLEEKVDVTREYVTRCFKSIAERCMQAEPVMEFDHEMKEMVEKKVYVEDPDNPGQMKRVGIYKFDAGGANKALECLGKSLGMFIDKHEVKVGLRLEDLVGGANEDEDESDDE